MVKVQRLFAKTNLIIQVCRTDKIPLGTKGRTSILSYREYVRPAELHSLATLVRLSLVDLLSANSK